MSSRTTDCTGRPVAVDGRTVGICRTEPVFDGALWHILVEERDGTLRQININGISGNVKLLAYAVSEYKDGGRR